MSRANGREADGSMKERRGGNLAGRAGIVRAGSVSRTKRKNYFSPSGMTGLKDRPLGRVGYLNWEGTVWK